MKTYITWWACTHCHISLKFITDGDFVAPHADGPRCTECANLVHGAPPNYWQARQVIVDLREVKSK